MSAAVACGRGGGRSSCTPGIWGMQGKGGHIVRGNGWRRGSRYVRVPVGLSGVRRWREWDKEVYQWPTVPPVFGWGFLTSQVSSVDEDD